jgi:hypothetical protein
MRKITREQFLLNLAGFIVCSFLAMILTALIIKSFIFTPTDIILRIFLIGFDMTVLWVGWQFLNIRGFK